MSADFQNDLRKVEDQQAKFDASCRHGTGFCLRSPTPDAPPWSPITPPVKPSEPDPLPELPALEHEGVEEHGSRRVERNYSGPAVHPARSPGDFIPTQPDPVPVSEDQNPDAIALRAALDLLQIQRAKALDDLRLLATQKETALSNTQCFIQNLIGSQIERIASQGESTNIYQSRSNDRLEEQRDAANIANTCADACIGHPFAQSPSPQNVVRCPPINWNKYSVDGVAFETLYQEQRSRPTAGSGMLLVAVENTQADHTIAAPYRPFLDSI